MKKSTALALAALLLFLAACGAAGEGTAPAASDIETTGTPAQSESEMIETETTAPAETLPEVSPSASAPAGYAEPTAAVILRHEDEFAWRYDLSEQELDALSAAVADIVRLNETERPEYDEASDEFTQPPWLYSVYFAYEEYDGSAHPQEVEIFSGGMVMFDNVSYACEAGSIDTALLDELLAARVGVEKEASLIEEAEAFLRADFAAAAEGCEIVTLKYDRETDEYFTDVASHVFHGAPAEGIDKNRLITLRFEYSGGAGAVYRGIGPGTEAAVLLIKTDEGWSVMNWAEIGG